MTMHASELLTTAHASLMSASSGGGVSIDFDGSVVIQFVAFVILFLIIKPLLIDPFLKLMEEREKRTEGARTAARIMDTKAGAILKKYETEIDNVRRIANEEREKLRADAQRLEAKILAEAREETAKVVEAGKATIASERDALRQELATMTETMSAEVASRVLGREVR